MDDESWRNGNPVRTNEAMIAIRSFIPCNLFGKRVSFVDDTAIESNEKCTMLWLVCSRFPSGPAVFAGSRSCHLPEVVVAFLFQAVFYEGSGLRRIVAKLSHATAKVD